MSWIGDFVDRLESGLSHARIYNGSAPEGAGFPYVVFNRITSDQPHHMTAASDIAFQTVQIDIYDDDHVSVYDQSELIRNQFDGFRGTMGSTTVQMCHLDSTRDDFIRPQDSSQRGRHRISMDFRFALTQSVPTF